MSALAVPAYAQDPAPQRGLDDLIPDAAVENPADWANERRVPEVEGNAEDAVPELDAPLAELPGLSVEWPDDLELQPIEPVEPDDSIQIAAPDLPERSIDSNLEVERLNDELALALPSDERAFPIRDDFIDRFEALSTIEGLSGSENNIAQLAARARSDQTLLIDILRTYGYYDGQVIRTVGGIRPGEERANPDRAAVRFDIIPGEQYKFGEIDLGDLGTARDADALRSAFELQTGDPVLSDKIVEERIDLDIALGETGYPFAVIDEPELLIDHSDATGDLTMPVSPNGKYVFGNVVSSLPEFLSGEHLSRIARFDPGEVYQRSLEQDLRRAITATGLVSTVTITPIKVAAPTVSAPGTVDMQVELDKAPLRTVAGAIGYGTEEGFRLEASWEHRNFFPPEGSLKFRGILGTQEQLAGVTFRKNNFKARDQVLTLDAYASTVDSDAFDAQTLAFVGTFEKTSTLLFQKPLSWSAGIELIATDERPSVTNGTLQARQTYFVGALPLSVLLDTTDDLLDPSEGFRLGGRISPEISRTQGVQSFYLRSRVDASYYQSVTDDVVIAARAAVASIPGTALTNIAPSRRLYAGGGSSVRGYGYQLIGPRDNLGQLTGGRSLVEAALEARIRTGFFDGALSVVPFVDAGTVSTSPTPSFDDIRIGAGVGIRYATGFGPIRVDVGVPLNPGPDDNPVAVYVSLGQAF